MIRPRCSLCLPGTPLARHKPQVATHLLRRVEAIDFIQRSDEGDGSHHADTGRGAQAFDDRVTLGEFLQSPVSDLDLFVELRQQRDQGSMAADKWPGSVSVASRSENFFASLNGTRKPSDLTSVLIVVIYLARVRTKVSLMLSSLLI